MALSKVTKMQYRRALHKLNIKFGGMTDNQLENAYRTNCSNAEVEPNAIEEVEVVEVVEVVEQVKEVKEVKEVKATKPRRGRPTTHDIDINKMIESLKKIKEAGSSTEKIKEIRTKVNAELDAAKANINSIFDSYL
jgi:hypothetical protein